MKHFILLPLSLLLLLFTSCSKETDQVAVTYVNNTGYTLQSVSVTDEEYREIPIRDIPPGGRSKEVKYSEFYENSGYPFVDMKARLEGQSDECFTLPLRCAVGTRRLPPGNYTIRVDLVGGPGYQSFLLVLQ